MVDRRINLPKEIENEIKKNYGNILKFYDTQIPLAVKTAESTSSGKSIFTYDKNNKVADAYFSFAREVLDDVKDRIKNIITKAR